MFYYDVKESGKRLKELRKSCGHTQETMAEAIGISYDGYKQIRAVSGDDMMNMLMTIRVKKCWIDFWRCLIRHHCSRRGAACMNCKGD